MTNQLNRFRPIALILIVVLAGLYYLFYGIGGGADALKVSGTVQAVEVVVGIEVEGQIAEVLVDDGDLVKAGDVLVRFTDEMLQAQYEQAEADLAKAQVNYEMISAQPLSQERQVDIAVAQLELLGAQQALQELLENSNLASAHAHQAEDEAAQALDDLIHADIQQAVALENIAIAHQMVDQAEKHLSIVSSRPPQTAIDQSYANMLLAENKVNNTIDDIALAKQKLKLGPKWFWPKESITEYQVTFRNLIKNLEIKLAWEQLAFLNAIEKYNELLKPVDPIELANAEADLAVAKAQLKQAQRAYERIKDGPSQADIAVMEAQLDLAKRLREDLAQGPDPDDLALAQARLLCAEANLELAEADTIQEQLAVARVQIEAAEAALHVIQTQLNKLFLTAPVDGTVLGHFVEEGEVVVPGNPAFTLADLDNLTITVYISEDHHKDINQGDRAVVNLNSFPNQLFSGTIIRIADQVEFAPRNVQTTEGYRTNVFGVKLVIDDPSGILKPGMPADVAFEE